MDFELAKFLQPFDVNKSKISQLTISLSATYRRLALESENQFLATPIDALPDGSETGCFLSIDVGGSNLRVGFVELLGKDSLPLNAVDSAGGAIIPGGQIEGKLVRKTHVISYPIEDHLKNDNEEQLFSWIGDCIAQVVRAQINEDSSKLGSVIPVGITFSFPMIQRSISDAILMPMGKGFKIQSDLGLDKLLSAGYCRHAAHVEAMHDDNGSLALPPIQIAAIANDSVATLASLAYTLSASPNARVAVGLIVATGTNATTTMPIGTLLPSKTAELSFPNRPNKTDVTKPGERRVVVNTEWGIHGTLPPIQEAGLHTVWDIELDAHCSFPGFQPFEYMTSGRYVGELVRLILVSFLVEHLDIPLQDLPSLIRTREKLPCIFLSDYVAQATSAEELLPHLQKAYPPESMFHWQWNIAAAEAFLYITRAIIARSARMNAAAVMALLAAAGDIELRTEQNVDIDVGVASVFEQNLQKEELIISYAGGVICQFPGYLELCQGAVAELVQMLAPGRKVTFRETRDGGLVGAAALAGSVWKPSGPESDHV